MATLKLTPQDDLDFTTGNLVFIDGPEEIGQKIGIRLRFFLAEWFLDRNLGADHHGITFSKQASDFERRQLFARIVAETPGVEELLEFTFQFDPATRKLTPRFRARVSGADEPVDFAPEFILA